MLMVIHKQIELQKIELDHREREIKLRARELAEREKRFNIKPNEVLSSIPSINIEPFIITIPNITEENNIQTKSEVLIDQNLINVIFTIDQLKFFTFFSLKISPEESDSKSIPTIVDTPKAKSTTKTSSDQATTAAARNLVSRN